MERKTLYDYWLILYRRRAIILLTIASAMATAWIVSQRLTPVYEAVSEFFVPETLPGPGFFSPDGLLGAATRQLPLPGLIQEREHSYRGILESRAIQLRVHSEVPDKSLKQLSKDVDIVPTKTHLLRVRVRDLNPTVAASAANAYPRALNEFLTDVSVQRQNQTIEAMKNALGKTQVQLAQARQDLQDFLVRARTADIQKEITDIMTRKATIEAEVERARSALRAVESRILVTEDRLRREGKVFVSSNSASYSDIARRLRQDISDIQAEIAGTRIQYTDKHPRVQNLLKRFEEKKRDLATEMDHLVASEIKTPNSLYEGLRGKIIDLYVEQAALKAEVNAKTQALEDLTRRSGRYPSQRLREDELRAEVNRLQRMVDSLRVSSEEARAQAVSRQDQVVILKEAEPPSEAKFPLPLFNAMIAAALGLIGGMYLAFFYEYITQVRATRSVA